MSDDKAQLVVKHVVTIGVVLLGTLSAFLMGGVPAALGAFCSGIAVHALLSWVF